ncbi:MAG TPA: decaprenyl-phosphate phosphoribosyltransferase [Acidimicrobiales bacterium]|nr:decaprenyl-phosphate phosphoribosyltransferase [Acidimicrobiales bacterium]
MSKVLPGATGLSGTQPAGARHSAARALVLTARPKQWAKNVLVFAAPGAAGVLNHGGPLARALEAFALFCAVSSGTYFLNDALDVRADREHPTKRFRPVAAGLIKVRTALVTGAALMAVAIGVGVALRWRLGLVLGIYVLVQFAYSLYLKHQPIFDLVSVAAGFVLRAIAGAVAIPVPVSQWFLIVATFGSLLMVTGKRVAEHAELGDDRGAHRATLDAYSPAFLRTVLAIAAGGAIIGYALWAFSLQTATLHHHNDAIWYQLSTVPVFIALLRYTFLVEAGHGAKPEDLVLSDRPLQVLGLCWVVLFALAIYA